MLLANKPIVFKDETAASVLIRSAEANGHSNVYHLLSGYGMRINEPGLIACLLNPERYLQIVSTMGLGDDAAALAVQRIGVARNAPRCYRSFAIPDRCFRRVNTCAFCSKCLVEHPYWRQQWQIRPFSVCIQHRCLLVNHCLECDRVPSIGRGVLAQCNHCKASLLAMRGPNANVDSMLEVQRLLETAQINELSLVMEFWDALRRFDKSDDSPATDRFRLDVAIAYLRGEATAFEHVLTLVVQRLPQTSPGVQLLPFSSGSSKLVSFADEIVSTVFPLAEVASGDERLSYLSKSEVCTLLKMTRAKLASLISSGQIAWPQNGGRQGKIPASEIEMRLQGFSQTEILYTRGGDPNAAVHRYKR